MSWQRWNSTSKIFELSTNQGASWSPLILSQIAFPATQNPSSDANTLDDYEEGTWTPIIGGTTSESGQTYTGTQNGTYIKIGKLVIVTFEVQLSAKGTITGNIAIKGLPFTVAGNANGVGAISWGNIATVGGWVNLVSIAELTSTRLLIRGTQTAGATNDNTLATADIANNTFFRGTAAFIASA